MAVVGQHEEVFHRHKHKSKVEDRMPNSHRKIGSWAHHWHKRYKKKHRRAMGNEDTAKICELRHLEVIHEEQGIWNQPRFRSNLCNHKYYQGNHTSASRAHKKGLFGKAFHKQHQQRTEKFRSDFLKSHEKRLRNHLVESGLTTLTNGIKTILIKTTRWRNRGIIIDSFSTIHGPIVAAKVMHSSISAIINEAVFAYLFV